MITQFPAPVSVDITYEHDQVHKGHYFSGGVYNASVADGATVELLLQISSTSTFHAKITVAAGGDSTIQIYEGTTFSSAGSAVTMSNHNRSSATSFAGTVTLTPTVTLDGSQINGTGYVAAGSKHSASGGDFGFGSEFILAKSTNYLLRATNNSGGAAKIGVYVEGYMPSL